MNSHQKNDEKYEKKSDPICVDGTWNFMSGAWDDRGCTSNSADGSILHGNSVLLCKGFKNTSRLVFRDKSLQETLGKLCKRESNDEENKEIHHCDGNDLNGNRFYYDEQRTDRPCSSCDRVEFSFLIFWIESTNCQRRESKGNNI